MVKFMAASLLAASAFANTEVSNKAVTCSGQEMIVTFDTNRDISLANLLAGTCEIGDGISSQHEGSMSSSHSITFNPYDCVGQVIDASDVSTYTVDVPISFSSSLSSVMDLLVKEHTFNATCGFQASYTAEYVFGEIAMNSTDEGEFEGDELSFELIAYDDNTYANELDTNATLNAGNAVYLELSANAAFDSSTFSFAPSSCTITEDVVDGQSYDLFDADCANDDVDFSMSYDSSTETWKMEYVLFLFASEQQGAYILSCNVDLCIASDTNSACANMCM
jgi:hypothetical protein